MASSIAIGNFFVKKQKYKKEIILQKDFAEDLGYLIR
jgi:hypothetical protein